MNNDGVATNSQERSGSGGSALKAMVSFFTLWHMDIRQEDVDAMERNFGFIPIVGLLLGVAVLVVMLILGILYKTQGFDSSLLMAVTAIATVYIGSKFIHFDGLTDFGDGMIVSGTREDHVRALKDTLIGAGGIGVALVTILITVSLYCVTGLWILVFAPVVEIMVKNSMVAGAAYGKPGNGMARRQVSMTTIRSLVMSTVISLVLGLVLAVVASLIYDQLYKPSFIDMVPVAFGVVFAVILSIVVGYLMAKKANSVFGMVNGDILGATNEIARPVVILAMALPSICWPG